VPKWHKEYFHRGGMGAHCLQYLHLMLQLPVSSSCSIISWLACFYRYSPVTFIELQPSAMFVVKLSLKSPLESQQVIVDQGSIAVGEAS
jgi:hypothetical protein